LSITNPTWPDPASNPGRRIGKPATNRLSYGASWTTYCMDFLWWTTPILKELLEEFWMESEWNLVNTYTPMTFKMKMI
jgi:hypothetical protein